MIRGLRGRRGLTLIEMVVVVAIVAVLAIAMVASIGSLRRADLNKTSSMLSASMRALYNLAIVNHRPYRLVIDLEKNMFWGEALQDNDPCNWYLDASDEGGAKSQTKKKDKEGDGETGENARRSRFTKAKQSLLTPRKIPKSVKVTGVITANSSAVQVDGLAAIHFFPGGRAEKAFIWLGEASTDEEVETEPEFTLSLQSLMGRVRKHTEPLDESEFFSEKRL